MWCGVFEQDRLAYTVPIRDGSTLFYVLLSCFVQFSCFFIPIPLWLSVSIASRLVLVRALLPYCSTPHALGLPSQWSQPGSALLRQT